MRAAAVFLSGLATAIGGALARTCDDGGIPREFATAICGGGDSLLAAPHAHCAGCAVMTVGGIMIAAAALMQLATESRATERARP